MLQVATDHPRAQVAKQNQSAQAEFRSGELLVVVRDSGEPRLEHHGLLALEWVQNTHLTPAAPAERWVLLLVASEERREEVEAHCSMRQLDWVRHGAKDEHQHR